MEAYVRPEPRNRDYADIASAMDRYPSTRHDRPRWYHLMESVLVVVRARSGLAGVGETNGGKATQAIVSEHLDPLLGGSEIRDPGTVETLWGLMHDSMLVFGSSGVARMALSAVDIALWDLLAKHRQMPVHELLGGALREQIPAYATTTDLRAAKALHFHGGKLSACAGPWDAPTQVDDWLTSLEAERTAVGTDFPLMIDAWMGWTLDFAVEMLPRLADLGIAWLEEPFPPAELDSYAALGPVAAEHGLRIAAGEHHSSLLGSRQLLATGGIRILQPDVRWCGGITELRRIIAMARQAGVPVYPHFGGEIWALHVLAASEGCELAEWYVDSEGGDTGAAGRPGVVGAPAPEGGLLTVPAGPGLGVELVF